MTEILLSSKDYKRILQWFTWYSKKTKVRPEDIKLAKRLEIIFEEEEKIEKE